MSEARYIVLRGCEAVNWAREEGRWYDHARMPQAKRERLPGEVVFGPTGEYETREDGVRAEVYRPLEATATEVEKALDG